MGWPGSPLGWSLCTCSFHLHFPALSQGPPHPSCRWEMAMMALLEGNLHSGPEIPWFGPCSLVSILACAPHRRSSRACLPHYLKEMAWVAACWDWGEKGEIVMLIYLKQKIHRLEKQRKSNHKSGLVLRPAVGRDHHSAWQNRQIRWCLPPITEQ